MSEDPGPPSNEPQPLGTSFDLTLKMVSDWHVGSGAGQPGNIDSLVRRDAQGLPYVPAKTLTGIWRDACERVALGLDNDDQHGVWNQWVNYLFGDQPATAAEREEWRPPRQALLSVRSAHLPLDLRQALKSKHVAREAITFVKPGIAIDPRTGSTRTDFLRFEEMARAGITVTARCEFRSDLNERDRRVASALLIAGSRLVERLGGNRRRGAGRCHLTVAGQDESEPWLDWISTQRPPHAPPEDTNSELIVLTDDVAAASGDWLRLRLRLSTTLPVIVSAGTIGNLIKTLDYIPGTYLLPHVTKKLKGVHTQAAIAQGDLLVTNATIEIENERGRAVPFSLAHPKTGRGLQDGKEVFNLFEEKGPQTQLKNHREGYVGSTANPGRLPFFQKIDPKVETHNVIYDDEQRPTVAVGGVYTYQAIPAGAVLRAELRLRQTLADALSQLDPAWFSKLEGRLTLGRANKDDYGVVELRVVGQPEQFSLPRPIKNELTVWLLSDLLLRDERLRPVASVKYLGAALAKKLNDGIAAGSEEITLTLRQSRNAGGLPSSFPRQRRTDSWQVAWRRPRASLAGLQAGTCAVFEVNGEINLARLREIEASGLGERRAEGYGQLCFNDSLLISKLEGLSGGKPLTEEKHEAIFLVPRDGSFSYARLIEREALRNELRRIVLGFAADRDNRKRALGIEIIGQQSKPRMTQLGALRSIVSRLQSSTDIPRIVSWLNHLAATPNRANEWPLDSLAYVEELITQSGRVWQLLKLDFTNFVLTEGGQEELKAELWPEAVRTLVDACVRAQKRDLEGV